MTRADEDLAFMLRYENIAWYENGKVRILDRRIYPIQTKYVECKSHIEVADAIRDMVTQSEGPYLAAAMGMALAAYEAVNGAAVANGNAFARESNFARGNVSASIGTLASTSASGSHTATANDFSASTGTSASTSASGSHTATANDFSASGNAAASMSTSAAQIIAFMEKAAYTLSHARPTTSAQMSRITNGSLSVIKQKIAEGASGKEIVEVAFEYALGYAEGNYRKYDVIGKNMAALIPSGGTILTQCFAGTVVGTMLRECRRTGNNIKVICAETRPYFQGSRLTASVACDMGFDVTVISDNMPAYTMQSKHVDIFTSASDVITCDGHIINKVGTFQIALAAKHFGIPYYVTGTPDPEHKDLSTTHIEERDAELVLMALDTKVTMPGVKGYYPAFDITPPDLCTGVVTEKGVFKPTELQKYLVAKITSV